MELIYGLGMLLLGSIATIVFFWGWIKMQEPKKKPDPEDNEVLKRSGLLDDSE